MAKSLTKDQKTWIVKNLIQLESVVLVQRKWKYEFGTKPSCRRSIVRIGKNFHVTGSVEKRSHFNSGRPVSVTTQENSDLVAQTFVEKPSTSQVRASLNLGIPRTSLQRIMKRIGFKVYRPRIIHGLQHDDRFRRLQFCESLLDEERRRWMASME